MSPMVDTSTAAADLAAVAGHVSAKTRKDVKNFKCSKSHQALCYLLVVEDNVRLPDVAPRNSNHFDATILLRVPPKLVVDPRL